MIQAAKIIVENVHFKGEYADISCVVQIYKSSQQAKIQTPVNNSHFNRALFLVLTSAPSALNRVHSLQRYKCRGPYEHNSPCK